MKKIFKKLAENGVYILLILVIGLAGVTGYIAKKREIYESEAQRVAEEIDRITEANKTKSKAEKEEVLNTEVSLSPKEFGEIAEVASYEEEFLEEDFVLPVPGETINEFSASELVYSKTMEDWRTHNGVDIAGKIGTQVKAVKSGKVKKVYKDELFGTTVEISHTDGSESRYCNLQEGELVDEGSFVETGQVIGGIGATAICESALQPHLHFELKIDGEYVNPFDFIK